MMNLAEGKQELHKKTPAGVKHIYMIDDTEYFCYVAKFYNEADAINALKEYNTHPNRYGNDLGVITKLTNNNIK